jgi:maintenance of mitochondrial morphology protein 1
MPSLAFTQGFMAGQAVLLCLFLCLFRYCFMTSAPSSRARRQAEMAQRLHTLHTSLEARSAPPTYARVPYEQGVQACIDDLMAQVEYDAAEPESLGWLNVLVAQLLMTYRSYILRTGARIPSDELPSSATAEKAAARLVFERILNEALQSRTMHILDPLTVTDIDIGCRYPRCSHARVRSAGTIEVDIEYVDALTLGIDTRLWLHVPHYRFGALDAAMCLRIERFAGTLAIEITETDVRVYLHPGFVLDAHLSSVFGSKSKLQDVPKIEDIVLARLHQWIKHRLVWPHAWHIPLPGVAAT